MYLINPKLPKLREERDRNDRRIAKLQSRNRDIDNEIAEIENAAIVGAVRAICLTPEDLAVFLETLKQNPFAPPPNQTKQEDIYENNET